MGEENRIEYEVKKTEKNIETPQYMDGHMVKQESDFDDPGKLFETLIRKIRQ